MTVSSIVSSSASPFFIHALPGETLQEIMNTTIPCFDLRGLDRASNRAELVQAFGDALCSIGFVAIYAPEITPMVNNAMQKTRDYFGQDDAAKNKDDHGNNGQTGYSPQGRETAAGAKATDLKATFFVTNNMPKWPEDPEFRSVMEPYLAQMSRYADDVMQIIFEFLGKKDEAIAGGDMRIRLAYYPEANEGDDPRSVWAAAHQDLNAVTLLPRPSRSGLQLLTKEGNWISVYVPEGYIIVNTGEQITCLTEGTPKFIQGTEHRVLNDDPKDRSARFATILFASLPDEYLLRPGVTVADHRLSRLFEMGSAALPKEEVERLRRLGLANNPCEAVKARYS